MRTSGNARVRRISRSYPLCASKAPKNKPWAAPEVSAIGSGRGFHFHFGVEIGDDVLERRDRLLDRGDLHQFPARDRTAAILQRDDEIAPLLLKLNKR